MTINHTLRKIWTQIINFFKKSKPHHPYRIYNIEQTKKGDYYVSIQVVGKNRSFNMKPEEILANDSMTLQFSQLDIRTLTYLGYLGINSPKYKVLAKHLSEQNHMLFSVYSRETDKVELRKASEIVADKELWQNLDRKDVSEVAYLAGSDQVFSEKEEIRKLKEAKAQQGKHKPD